MSYDPFQTVGGNSGTANVPTGQSTAGVYQGADIADNLVFPISGANAVTITAPVQFSGTVSFANNLSISGNLVLGPTAGSGTSQLQIQPASGNIVPAGSGFTTVAAGSHIFAPVGYFFIQISISGDPLSGLVPVKVPVFLS